MPITGSRYLAFSAVALIVAGCGADHAAPTEAELRAPIFASSAPSTNKSGHEDENDLRHLDTHLRGTNEVPANDSRARGVAIFKVAKDGQSIEYKLIVAKINNPFMAHIHMAAKGVNGPIVVWLFPSTTPGVQGPLGVGRVDGLIAKGTITATNLVGPLAGHPLADLLAAIQNSNTYVNVHTNDGVAPVTNLPGDIPGGEIRDQLGPKHEDK